jgi:hypothetical protein
MSQDANELDTLALSLVPGCFCRPGVTEVVNEREVCSCENDSEEIKKQESAIESIHT